MANLQIKMSATKHKDNINDSLSRKTTFLLLCSLGKISFLNYDSSHEIYKSNRNINLYLLSYIFRFFRLHAREDSARQL